MTVILTSAAIILEKEWKCKSIVIFCSCSKYESEKWNLLNPPVYIAVYSTLVYFRELFPYNLHLIIYLITVFSFWHLSTCIKNMFLAFKFISSVHISAIIFANHLGMNQMLEVDADCYSISPKYLLKCRTYFSFSFSLILLNIFQNVIHGLSYSIVTEGTPVSFWYSGFAVQTPVGLRNHLEGYRILLRIQGCRDWWYQTVITELCSDVHKYVNVLFSGVMQAIRRTGWVAL